MRCILSASSSGNEVFPVMQMVQLCIFPLTEVAAAEADEDEAPPGDGEGRLVSAGRVIAFFPG